MRLTIFIQNNVFIIRLRSEELKSVHEIVKQLHSAEKIANALVNKFVNRSNVPARKRILQRPVNVKRIWHEHKLFRPADYEETKNEIVRNAQLFEFKLILQ